MSGQIAMLVWASDLDPTLKPLASLMALHGNKAGESIYPGIDRLQKMLGHKWRRTTERQLQELRRIGLLVTDTNSPGGRLPGGRGRSTVYAMNVSALPQSSLEPRSVDRGLEVGNLGVETGVPQEETPASGSRTPVFGSANPGVQIQEPRSPDRVILERDQRERSGERSGANAPPLSLAQEQKPEGLTRIDFDRIIAGNPTKLAFLQKGRRGGAPHRVNGGAPVDPAKYKGIGDRPEAANE